MNYYVLLIFAPVLILIGVLGFIIPEKKSLTSGAPAYNIFHIIFGIIGLLHILKGDAHGIATFNVVFGAIDLYQAAASYLHIFPGKYFKWKRADDVLHIVIGAFLVLIGLFAG